VRRTLPILEWPEADRAAWAQAQTKYNVSDEGATAAHWAPATRRISVQHYCLAQKNFMTLEVGGI